MPLQSGGGGGGEGNKNCVVKLKNILKQDTRTSTRLSRACEGVVLVTCTADMSAWSRSQAWITAWPSGWAANCMATHERYALWFSFFLNF